MKKRRRFAGRAPQDKIEALFMQWTTNAAELSSMYPDDERLSELLEAFVRAFDTATEWYKMRVHIMLVVAAQPMLPDFTTDDSEYGDVPF